MRFKYKADIFNINKFFYCSIRYLRVKLNFINNNLNYFIFHTFIYFDANTVNKYQNVDWTRKA